MSTSVRLVKVEKKKVNNRKGIQSEGATDSQGPIRQRRIGHSSRKARRTGRELGESQEAAPSEGRPPERELKTGHWVPGQSLQDFTWPRSLLPPCSRAPPPYLITDQCPRPANSCAGAACVSFPSWSCRALVARSTTSTFW